MILFGATWCPHCQVVKKFLTDNPQITNVQMCDVDKDFETPTRYGVKQLPALSVLDAEYTVMVESMDIIEYIKGQQ